MGWPNGAVRTPLRVSVSGSVYTDGMNVNTLGLPGSQAPLDESSIVFVPGDETMSGQRGGGDGKRKENLPKPPPSGPKYKRRSFSLP
jgi:hypothetical protein